MFENRKIKIAIAGIGGIGGYIGGKLAHYYSLFENVDIIFIAKGDTIKAIEKSGLKLISNEITYKCKPTLISNKPDEIGEVDLFILCSKTFSVPSILKEFATCLTANSTIITTQNTINGKETIMPYLSNNSTVLEGCIYISSSKVSATKIQHITAQAKLYFGTEGELNKNGEEIAKILNYAGIDAIYTTNISRLLWKKFMFASPAAIVTALYQITMAEILENRETEYLYINLIAEIMELAKAKDVPVDELTVLNNISILNNFKGYVKSSFQLDLENNRHSEINALVKHVIEEAKLFNISTPFFDKALTELIEKYSLLEIN